MSSDLSFPLSVTHTPLFFPLCVDQVFATARELLHAAVGESVMAAESSRHMSFQLDPESQRGHMENPSLGVVKLGHLHFQYDYLTMARGMGGSDCPGLGHVPTVLAEVLHWLLYWNYVDGGQSSSRKEASILRRRGKGCCANNNSRRPPHCLVGGCRWAGRFRFSEIFTWLSHISILYMYFLWLLLFSILLSSKCSSTIPISRKGVRV